MQNEELQEIIIKHTDTLFVNQGVFSALFTVDGAQGDYQALKVGVEFLDPQNRKVDTGEFEIAEVGTNSTNRYGHAFVESDKIGGPALTIRIVSASAEQAQSGLRVDLLARELVQVEAPIVYKMDVAGPEPEFVYVDF